ncbi:MAG: DUF721 domain-containing protein [Planctomycetes bacterium]|nr:DUF721 domain-containing protein [Planctomycetota bacterium]
MNDRQYRQMLLNRTRRLTPLFASGAGDGLLRRAARDVRGRRTAQAAWEAVSPPEWATVARVASCREGVLLIEAAAPAWRERIRRQAGALLRPLQERVGGLKSIRVVAPGEEEQPDSAPR